MTKIYDEFVEKTFFITECINEIVYYPINNDANESFYPFAENYFTIAFFNIANEQP